VEVQYGI
jgi:hypothetical protein